MFTHDQIWLGIDRLASAYGYSPSGLAKKAGLDPTSFNKSKRKSPDDKPRWPSTESLSKILAVTGATMSDFIALIESEHYRPQHAGALLSDEDMAAVTSDILIKTQSVLFNVETPFTLKSGRQSPVYIDCRRLISFPEERNILMNFAAHKIIREIGHENFDVIAGGETAGIPYAAFIAERLQKPMIYVRKEPKGYGRMAQIEGALPEKEKIRAILVEDLQTDGGSKEVFVKALRDAGMEVSDTFVVFHYGIFESSQENMRRLNVTLHNLTDWWAVLKTARDKKYFDKKTTNKVEAFLKNPEDWQG